LTDQIAVSVIVPIYNEEQTLAAAMETLAAHFDRILGVGVWQFVLVNNGSADKSGEIIEDVRARWPATLAVFEKTPNYGLALRAGIAAARAPWIHLIDVEQWDMPFLAWAWANRNSYDLFIASKRADPTLNRQHMVRRILSWGLNALLQLLFQFSGTDTHGPKFINRTTLQPILDVCVMDRGQYDTEIVLRSVRAGYRIVEAPMPYAEQRPPRKAIIKKIVWNMFAMNRMRGVMRKVPYTGPTRIWRVAREDVLAAASESGDTR
jgi:glycosyltransferase involved in cell wall biosynthesis